MDYFQRTGNATIILHWSSDSISKQPIPFEQFNHYDCQDNSAPFGPNGCATIKLATYEYSKITKKTKFCYEINVLSQYGNQCDIESIQMNSINCVKPYYNNNGSPKISGITKFVGGTKGQYCLEYNGHVQIVPTTTMDLSFPNQSNNPWPHLFIFQCLQLHKWMSINFIIFCFSRSSHILALCQTGNLV